MSLKHIVVSAVLFVALAAGGYGLYRHSSHGLADSFDASPSRVSNDLVGQTVPMAFGQAWPFDGSQKIEVVRVLGKKQTDGFVQVYVQVRSSANVTPPAESKDKAPPKAIRVKVDGVLKLHYEKVADEWFLLQVDNLSLKAVLDDAAPAGQ